MMALKVVNNIGEKILFLYAPATSGNVGSSIVDYSEIMARAWIEWARRDDVEDLIIHLLEKKHSRKDYDYHQPLETKSETSLKKNSMEESITERRIPNESHLRQARLLNVPKRGFCVSADIEKITADSYRYLNDNEEFEPPNI